MFRTIPLSIIISFSLYAQQWYVSYRLCWLSANQYGIYHCCMYCTVKNSWWWTEELSETCIVLFQK